MLRCESCGNEETFHLYETITQLISLTCTPTEPNAYVVNEVLASYPMESEWGEVLCGTCAHAMDAETARLAYETAHPL